MARLLLTGNEAFAHAALEAGIAVVAGHPGDPATSLPDTVARQCAKGRSTGVTVEWSVNEKAALEVCAAASMSGLRALFVSQQAGLNVALDTLMAINSVGVRGGLVLFVADDPAVESSQFAQDTRSLAEFAQVPIFDPVTPEQGYKMMKQAFDLSETYGSPVIMRSTTHISRSSTFFDVKDRTEAFPPRGALGNGFASFAADGSEGFVHDPQRWVLSPDREGADVAGTPAAYESAPGANAKNAAAAPRDIAERLKQIAHTNSYDLGCSRFNPIYINGMRIGSGAAGERSNPRGSGAFDEGSLARIGIAAGGEAAAMVQEAIELIDRWSRRAGMVAPDCKLIQIGTPFPFPRSAVMRFYKGLSHVLVIEEIDPFIENELLKVSGKSFLGPTVHGRLSGEAPSARELAVESVALSIAAFYDKYAAGAAAADNQLALPGGAQGEAVAPAGTEGPVDQFIRTTPDPFADIDDAELMEELRADMAQAGEASQFGAGSFQDASFRNMDMRELRMRNGSKVAKRLAALQKQAKFLELAERAVGPGSLYEFVGDLPERTPALCAGCPHRGSFLAAKGAISRLGISRSDVIFCGDVGCSALGAGVPLDMLDTCLCLGAGATMAQGFTVANPGTKSIAFVGDDSFFANGMSGIANAVWNGRDVTFVVLDNMTTAACGLEPNAGTGVTISGRRTRPIDIEHVLRSLGVEAVHRADPLNLAEAETACARAIDFAGPSAVIMRSPCIYLRRNDRVAIVNQNKCTGCKKCIIDTGCPALSFDISVSGPKSSRRGQAVIDMVQCNGCGLCAQVCPFQAIVVRRRADLVGEEALADLKVANQPSRETRPEREERPKRSELVEEKTAEERPARERRATRKERAEREARETRTARESREEESARAAEKAPAEEPTVSLDFSKIKDEEPKIAETEVPLEALFGAPQLNINLADEPKAEEKAPEEETADTVSETPEDAASESAEETPEPKADPKPEPKPAEPEEINLFSEAKEKEPEVVRNNVEDDFASEVDKDDLEYDEVDAYDEELDEVPDDEAVDSDADDYGQPSFLDDMSLYDEPYDDEDQDAISIYLNGPAPDRGDDE